MSYTANNYNYATPLSSTGALVGDAAIVPDLRYFTLDSNTLDGSCVPVSGDVGLWGAVVADEYGALSTPFVVTVTDETSINAFRIIGSQYSYPVAFTVEFYNGTVLLHTITETANNKVEYVAYMPSTLLVTHYVISVSRISRGGSVARLYNVNNPGYVKRSDVLRFNAVAVPNIYETESTVCITTADYLHVAHSSSSRVHSTVNADDRLAIRADSIESHVLNTFDTFIDTLKVSTIDTSVLTNVHTRMKDPSRRIYGKVFITYTDPMLDDQTSVETNMEAHNSRKDQITDGVLESDGRYFTLYDNSLAGGYELMTEESQVGWVSGAVSDSTGHFSTVPYLRINFSARPVVPMRIYFDDSHGAVPEEFSVEFFRTNDTSEVLEFVGNSLRVVPLNDTTFADVTAIAVNITKMSKAGVPAVILEIPVLSTFEYDGLQDVSKLMSIDMLEELTYEDEVEALGGVSANEVTVVLDNSDRAFYFNNPDSAIAKQLKRNRRIEPWLGTEIVPGEIEWYKQGTYWSYSWKVPVNGLTATVVGFDTLGLLDVTPYTDHQVYINKSFGELVDIVLTDARKSLSFLTWRVDAALYDVVVPYAWFESASHTAALRKLSQAYPMHVYCDRDGNVCAAPQKLHLDYFYDKWSDSTNVISKEYSSLYTTLPNVVNVKVNIPQLVTEQDLVQDNLVFNVASVPTRTLNFSKPYVSDLQIVVDKDASVSYTYEVYSWGIAFRFTGSGSVRHISCVGTAVDVTNTSTITRRNDESVRLNGAVTRDIAADFIQTSSLATLLIDRIFDLSANDRYDAAVTYRGDIALSINDPIILFDGIAPDNRYNIRRHQLSWNGSLSGSADLNT